MVALAPFTSRGLHKMSGRLIPTRPATRPRPSPRSPTTASTALDAGGVILVGERLATVPGALTAAADLARTTRRPAGLGAASRR